MNCNCVTDLENKVVQDQPIKGKVVQKATLRKLLTFNNEGGLSYRPCIEMELELEGRKRPQTIEIAYSFCPFCGESIAEKEEEDKDGN